MVEVEPNSSDRLEVDFDKQPTDLYISICEGDWESAVTTTQEHPIQSKTWVVRYDEGDSCTILWRFLPLHSACARQPPESIIEALLVANPEAAREKDDQGMLPIHYACGNRASESVINMLLIANPRGVSEKDPQGGKLPIHHLCQWGTNDAGTVNMLLAMYPESIKISDNTGYTPLDLARDAKYPGKSAILMALKRCALASKDSPSSPFAEEKQRSNNNVLKKVTSVNKEPAVAAPEDDCEGIEVMMPDSKETKMLREQLQESKDELRKMKDENKSFFKLITKSEENISLLNNRLKEKDEEVTSLTSKLADYTLLIKEQEKRVTSLARDKNKLQSDNASLKSLVKEQEKKIKGSTGGVVGSASSKASHSEYSSSTFSRVDQLSEELAMVQVEHDSLKKMEKQTKIEYEGMKDQVAVYQAEIVSLRAEMIRVQNECDAMRRKVEDYEKQQQKATQQLSVSHGSTKSNEGGTTVISETSTTTTTTLAKVDSQLSSECKKKLEVNLKKAKDEIAQKSKLIKTITNKLDIAHKQLDTLREKLDNEREESRQKLRHLEDTIDERNAELEVTRPKIESLESQIDNLERQLEILRDAKASLENQTQDFTDCQAANEILHNKLSDVESVIGILLEKQAELMTKTMKQEENLKAAAAERERKILEIALLEEKLRSSSVCDHEELMKAMKEQEEDIKAVLEKMTLQ